MALCLLALSSLIFRALFIIFSSQLYGTATTGSVSVFWIEENLAKGSPVGQLSLAYGRDTMNLRSVVYTSLAQDTAAQYFRVDASDGTIYAAQTIDREALCDDGRLSGDDAENDYVIRRIRATNEERQLHVSQKKMLTNNDSNLSHNSDQIRPQRAADMFNGPLQPSTTCRVKFQVHVASVAVDGVSDSILQDVQIMIADVNDNKPTFSSDVYILKILESSPIDAEFRLPTAHDADSGMHGITLYKIDHIHANSGTPIAVNSPCQLRSTTEMKLGAKLSEIKNAQNHHLNINNNNNNKRQATPIDYPFAGDYFIMHSQRHANGHLQPQLKQIRPLDREQTEALYLCLIAQDGGGNQGSLAVKIELMDANDNVPQWRGLPYKVSLSECDPPDSYGMDPRVSSYLSPIGPSGSGLRHLITLHADDKDLGVNGECVFRLGQQSVAGGTRQSNRQMPNLIVKENKVFLASKLDHETLPHFFIPVEVVDGGGLVNYTEIEVIVEDCNDHAPVITVIPLKPRPIANKRNVTGSGSGLDGGGNSRTSTFHADPILWLEEEQPARIDLATIMAQDRDKMDAGRVTCRLEQQKLAPSQTSYFDLVPVDNSGTGLQVPSVTGNMKAPTSMFTLYKRDGVKIDREKTTSIVLSVLCTDNASIRGHETRKLIYIHILDVNDNPPKITPSDYTPLDRSAPFVTQTFSVPENQPFGTLIGTVQATDPDDGPNAELQYSFLEPPYPSNWTASDNPLSNALTELFELERSTGKLFTQVPLDREFNASYVAYVKVTDSGVPQLSSIVRVQILVADVNDNPPRFVVTEGASGRIVFHTQESDGERPVHGRLIGQLVTQDDDLGSNKTVHFSFVEGSLTPGGLPVTYRVTAEGKIYADGLLDREQCEQHQFTVRAVDGGPVGHRLTASAVVIVKLDDLNDSPPQFTHPPSKTISGIPSDLINITVKTPPGLVIYHVQATDMDKPANTKLNFVLRSAKFLSNYFTLRVTDSPIASKSNGFSEGGADLILVNSLTELPAVQSGTISMHMVPKEYFVYIIVKDNDDEPSHSATARLRIHVYQDRPVSISPVESNHVNGNDSHPMSTTAKAQRLKQNADGTEPVDDAGDASTYAQYRYHKTTSITVILILAIVIICVFLGIFCFVAFIYLRGTQRRGRGRGLTPPGSVASARKNVPFSRNGVGMNVDLSPPGPDDAEQLAYWELLNHNYTRTACSEQLTSEAGSVDQNDGSFDRRTLPYLLTAASPPLGPTEQFATLPTQLSTLSRRDNRLTGALFLEPERSILNKDSTQVLTDETTAPRQNTADVCQMRKSSGTAQSTYTTNSGQAKSIGPVYFDGVCFTPHDENVQTFDCPRLPTIKSCFKPVCQYQRQSPLTTFLSSYVDHSSGSASLSPQCNRIHVTGPSANESGCSKLCNADEFQQSMVYNTSRNNSSCVHKQDELALSQLTEYQNGIQTNVKKDGVKFREYAKESPAENDNVESSAESCGKRRAQDGRDGSAPAVTITENASDPSVDSSTLLQSFDQGTNIRNH